MWHFKIQSIARPVWAARSDYISLFILSVKCASTPPNMLSKAKWIRLHIRQCKTSMFDPGLHFSRLWEKIWTREGTLHMWSLTQARGDPKAQPNIPSAEQDSSHFGGKYQIPNKLHFPIATVWILLHNLSILLYSLKRGQTVSLWIRKMY